MTTTVAILGTRYPDFGIEQEVLGGDTKIVASPGADAREVVETAGQANVVIAGSRPAFPASVIEHLNGCLAIVRSGIGVDTIDLEAAHRAGIVVANVPDYGTEAVAQHTLAMALASCRRLVEADALTKAGRWNLDDMRPIGLPSGQTAGVIGFGRIGARVAELLAAVGFGRLLAYDPHHPATGPLAEAVPLETLLAESDVVTLHAPPPSGGEPLLNSHRLAAMKPGSVLINTSRGALVDLDALAAGLARGAPRVAALDVFDPEPPDLTSLASVNTRVLLTPHMAWYSEESQSELRRRAAEEARRILDGKPPNNPVLKESASP